MQIFFILLLALGLVVGFVGALYLIVSASVGFYRESRRERKNPGGNR